MNVLIMPNLRKQGAVQHTLDILRRFREMGCVCFENTEMGIYFIEDPDGYWLEIIPVK